jgi:cephalosporin-C deacetylase-like acetyl esterase
MTEDEALEVLWNSPRAHRNINGYWIIGGVLDGYYTQRVFDDAVDAVEYLVAHHSD